MTIKLTKEEYAKAMADIGARNWQLLSLIRLMSEEGVCELTYEELGSLLNVSASTVKRSITDLLAVELQGEKIMESERSFHKRSLKVTEMKIVKRKAQAPKQKEAPAAKHRLATSKGVMEFWREQYAVRYGSEYAPTNWAREMSMIKSKLLKNYEPELLQEMIIVVMRLYDQRWKSQGWSRPQIGQMASWLAQEALPFAEANLKAERATQDYATLHNTTQHVPEQAKSQEQEVVIETEDGEDYLAKFDKKWGLA